MSKNLIFNAFAYANNNFDKKGKEYLACVMVSLCSAKMSNSDDVVALITNTQLPNEFLKILEMNDIKIFIHEFENFKFEEDIRWSLAFYKLCALEWAVNNLDYENYLIVDTDTYFQGSIKNVWKETKDDILLYILPRAYDHNILKLMREEYSQIYNRDLSLIHYGGEFVAGNKQQLIIFMNKCRVVYNKMMSSGIRTKQGDEFIVSVVATENREHIKPANPYIHRYWTGQVYLVSTNYVIDPVAILHLPSEKNSQFILLYKYLLKKEKFPHLKIVHWMTCMPKKKTHFRYFIFKILAKLIRL